MLNQQEEEEVEEEERLQIQTSHGVFSSKPQLIFMHKVHRLCLFHLLAHCVL